MYTCMCIYMLYTKVVIYVVTDTGCIDMCVYRQTYTHTHISSLKGLQLQSPINKGQFDTTQR